MFYTNVQGSRDPKRTAERLLILKQALAKAVPAKNTSTVLLATWNIREFDSAAYGPRGLECLYYIAEILSHFDLIAVQEVREDLHALDIVNDIMGSRWHRVVSDVTEGTPGNRERMAFLYDSHSVAFNGIAGEVVMPVVEVKGPSGKTLRYDPSDQLYRTPYLCGFRTGWTDLMLCTVHIAYGEGQAESPVRVKEIRLIADLLAQRARERRDYSNLVLLGDFNIFSRTDTTMKAITDAGFSVPPELQSVPNTNTGSKRRFYDQIAVLPKSRRFRTTGRAGVFNYYDHVFREDDQALYIPEMGAAYETTSKGAPRTEAGKRTYFRTYWRTYQMSDHLPMWVELKADFSDEYLGRIAAGQTG